MIQYAHQKHNSKKKKKYEDKHIFIVSLLGPVFSFGVLVFIRIFFVPSAGMRMRAKSLIYSKSEFVY